MNKKELTKILYILENELISRKGYYAIDEDLNKEDKELNMLVLKLAIELDLYHTLEPFNRL
tara:strand:+ start:720 stop:902 length:183 start_codon:yes stop_codon:yes gene_type:complete